MINQGLVSLHNNISINFSYPSVAFPKNVDFPKKGKATAYFESIIT